MSERDREEKAERDRELRRQEEIGRKGGAASMAAPMHAVSAREAEVISVERDKVRWGPAWAGLLVALPIQLILSGIGMAILLRAYNPAATDYAQRVSSALGAWSAVSALIALFVGGYISSRMATASGLRNGWLQGSLVWALFMLLGVILGALGAVGFSGTFGGIQALLGRGIAFSGPEAQALARSASNAAWWFVVGAIISWITAVVGGLLGSSARYHAEDVV